MSAVTGVSTSTAAYRGELAQLVRNNSVQGKTSEEQNESAAEKATENDSGGSAGEGGSGIDLRA